MKLAFVLPLVVVSSGLSSGVVAGDDIEKMLQELVARHENGADAPKEFEIGEEELNAFLKDPSKSHLPAGIESPWIRFEESLAIVGATLDLDKLEGQLPKSSVLQFLSGQVPVEIATRVKAGGGVGKLILERITLAGIPLPADFIASFIGDVDTSEFLPPGFRLGDAFSLPYDLESIRLQPGMALVLQRANR
ncbi:MAG: hypothetical protein E2P02_15315 [Acidobacteria bacterium]|nr:MAG: hypothetical protein E2P02_15315 [Acidobacteriota bacterium]